MKKVSKLFALGLIVVFSLILTTCDLWKESDSFHSRLRGTWEVKRPGEPYNGSTLVITSIRIKISGFTTKMMNDHGHNNTQRPFGTIAARDINLEGNSGGTFDSSNISNGCSLTIKDVGGEWRDAIYFTYDPTGSDDMIIFKFGDFTEYLIKTSN